MHMFDQVCDFNISLIVVDYLQLNLNIFNIIIDERNVKIVRDSRKSLSSVKFNNSKTPCITRFDKNAR